MPVFAVVDIPASDPIYKVEVAANGKAIVVPLEYCNRAPVPNFNVPAILQNKELEERFEIVRL